MTSTKRTGSLPTTDADKCLAEAEKRARRTWVTIIVGLLGLQVVVGVTSIVLAVGDPTVAIIPNYHQSAVNWDSTRRARLMTQQLGWQVSISAEQWDENRQRRMLQVAVQTEGGYPVEQLHISAKVYHHARGATIYTFQLSEDTPGVYSGLTQLTQAGLWQVELQIEGDHGIAALTQELLVP